MANEISWRHTATGAALYTTIRSAARTMWNTAGTPALEALTVVNWADYDIALTETPASSYFYVGAWPAGLTTAGWYWLDIYVRAGGSPAIGDALTGGLVVWWDGTTAKPWATDTAQIAGTAQTAGDVVADVAATHVHAAGAETEATAAHAHAATAETQTIAATITTAAQSGLATVADINAEVDAALSDINLDHLLKTATAAADMTTEITDNTIMARVLAGGDTSLYNPATAPLTLLADIDAEVDII